MQPLPPVAPHQQYREDTVDVDVSTPRHAAATTATRATEGPVQSHRFHHTRTHFGPMTTAERNGASWQAHQQLAGRCVIDATHCTLQW